MKELSIEEKAKSYDEIIKKANKMHHENCETCKVCLEELIPELAESEDERIRKALMNGFNKLDKSAVWYNGFTNGQIIAWLEKQGEQWNKDDETILENTIILLEHYAKGLRDFEKNASITWLKSLKDRVVLQPKQEWSEEDEKHLNRAISILDINKVYTTSSDKYEDTINWLKSLKDRYTWKPSEEQMVAIQEAMNIVGVLTITGSKINSLYQDLKKLKG